jgi:hypothetical protein
MKKFLTRSLSVAVIAVAVLLSANSLSAPVSALSAGDQILGGAGQAAGPSSASTSDITVVFTKVVNTILYVLGAIAVIMIVIGGIRYVTSGGDASGVTAAKNTILYAVIGLIVAILAFAIVNFVARSFGA